MNKDKKLNDSNARLVDDPKFSIEEVRDELAEYNATKKTVTDLLNYKRSLIDIENSEFDKINEIKGKALNAINHLFNDIINTKK